MFNQYKIVYLDLGRKPEIELFLEEWTNKNSSIEVQTSGSTGKPKIIQHKKENMRISAEKTIRYFSLKKGGSAYLCLSTETIAGKMMIVRALLNDMQLIVGPVSANSLDKLNSPVDFCAVVPIQLQHSLTHHPEKLKLISSIIVGGAPVSIQLEKQLIDCKLSVYQTYGMTETVSHVALKKIGFESTESYNALPLVKFSIGTEGNLLIHYPEIGLDELHTNDRVELISDTSFIWLGRTDFIINSGGVKISPEEVEVKLSALIHAPFFVTGATDEKLGSKVVLYLEGNGDSKINLDDLAKILPKYLVPKEVFYVPQFSWTSSHKINRSETIKRLAGCQ